VTRSARPGARDAAAQEVFVLGDVGRGNGTHRGRVDDVDPAPTGPAVLTRGVCA
jgi:hypothetical protein